jgi:hypothetical protein
MLNNLPDELIVYINYTRELRFEDRPDYGYLKRLLKAVAEREKFEYDFIFDWTLKKEQDEEAKTNETNNLNTNVTNNINNNNITGSNVNNNITGSNNKNILPTKKETKNITNVNINKKDSGNLNKYTQNNNDMVVDSNLNSGNQKFSSTNMSNNNNVVTTKIIRTIYI